ncbi:hypothetical protein CDIK_0640 [Cucumispora dikerogammari]|nr:hypothetical protein CDIK_0640 [Cucumispora dikerogammari]
METQILIQFSPFLHPLITKDFSNQIPYLSTSSFKWKDSKLYFIYNSKYFETKLITLPTVIESYKVTPKKEKDITKKIYKTNNISQILYIFDSTETNLDINKEIEKIVNSGITPPTQWIKPNMFFKKRKLTKNERLLNEILERDTAADLVEYEVDNLEIDVLEKDFIEEIETELVKTEVGPQRVEIVTSVSRESELVNQIAELERLCMDAPNPILKERFKVKIMELKKELKRD